MSAVRLLSWFVIDFPSVSTVGRWPAQDLADLVGTGRWRAPTPADDLALQSYGDEVLDELLRNMPTAVLETKEGIELIRSCAQVDGELGKVLEPAVDGGWQMVEARISLWDVGIGLATFVYDLPRHLWSELSSTVISTRGAVYGMLPEVRRVTQILVGRSTKSLRDHSEKLSVLWGNPNYLVRVAADLDTESRQVIARIITTDGLDCRMEGYPSAVIRIGLHCSVISDSFKDGAADLVVRLGGVHQVCWAIALIHDAKLAAEVARIVPGEMAPTIAELRGQTDRILREYHLVRSFRLHYASVEAHLMPSAKVLWHVLEEAWKFERVLAVLDDRLDFVRTTHQQLSTTVLDHRSRLLNELVAAFTFLNIFGIVIAALTFGVLPTVSQRAIPLEIIMVTLLLNALAYLIFRKKVNKHR